MTRRRKHVVACLSGHGIGPEVMAEASRALAQVSHLHGFAVEQVHLPFGSEALTRSGQALPGPTRRATLGADAILVAASETSALASVESELDLRSRVDRVVFGPRGVVTFLSPLHETARAWTLGQAFALARASRALVTVVGGDSTWRDGLEAESARHHGIHVEELPVGAAFRGLAFDPGRFDVVVVATPTVEALVEVTASNRTPRVAASGRLGASSPGVFTPTHGAAEDIAGQGVANPAEMLLAAALMLSEGLGERSAAETLTGAVLDACSKAEVTPDLVTSGVGATTREFADVVLSTLPHSVTNAEFYREAVA